MLTCRTISLSNRKAVNSTSVYFLESNKGTNEVPMCLIGPIGSFIAIANLMKDSVIENYPFGDPQGTTSTSAIRDTSSTAAFLGVV